MNSQFRKGVAIAASALLVAACDPATSTRVASAGPSGRNCFNARSVNDFNAIGDESVIVRVGANQYYQLGILGSCPDIDWSLRVGLRSTSGSSWVCEGLDAELLVPSPIGVQRCPVLSVHPMTPEAAKAAIAQHR